MDLQDLAIKPGKIHLVREILHDGVTGSVKVLGRCGEGRPFGSPCWQSYSTTVCALCFHSEDDMQLFELWPRTDQILDAS